MKVSPHTLEQAIVSVLLKHHLDVHREGFEYFLRIDFDLPMTFNLTTFAKDLAKRLEQAK